MDDWITDRLPTEEDADCYGDVRTFAGYYLVSWYAVQDGEPWKHTSKWHSEQRNKKDKQSPASSRHPVAIACGNEQVCVLASDYTMWRLDYSRPNNWYQLPSLPQPTSNND